MMISKFVIKKLLKKGDVINHYSDKLQNPYIHSLIYKIVISTIIYSLCKNMNSTILYMKK